MRSTRRIPPVRAARVLGVTALLGLLGCGPGGPKTYPISGNVDLAGGDVSVLAGNHIEVALQSDPTVRAPGAIQPDGGFTLEMLQAGTIRKGAREGTYQLRIVLTDEDRDRKNRASRAIAPRFLRFETSGLSCRVPTDGGVILKVSPR